MRSLSNEKCITNVSDTLNAQLCIVDFMVGRFPLDYIMYDSM